MRGVGVVRAVVAAVALLATAGCSTQVGDLAEASRVREVNSEILEALSYTAQDLEVRGVGCRYEDCVSVRSTVTLEQTDPQEACDHVRDVFTDLEVRLDVSEPIEGGCRFIGRFGDHHVGASVRGAEPVTVSVRATALGTGR
jgi:hypothetical protein